MLMTKTMTLLVVSSVSFAPTFVSLNFKLIYMYILPQTLLL